MESFISDSQYLLANMNGTKGGFNGTKSGCLYQLLVECYSHQIACVKSLVSLPLDEVDEGMVVSRVLH